MATRGAFSAELQRQFEDLASRFMASDLGQRVIGWHEQLGERDRLALRGMALFLGVVLAYVTLVSPVIERGERAQRRLQEERALLDWLRAHRAEAGSTDVGARPDKPLATLVNESAQQNKLNIRRYEPAGDAGMKVWIEGASFNSLVKWMYQLDGQYGVQTAEFTLEREEQPGKVSARLTLQE